LLELGDYHMDKYGREGGLLEVIDILIATL
jgi:hypothetical protein